ncbi:MAG: helix-turn-helix transcriptional regulator [Lachnospiraceae bacterium]|nr:helix-turn-helix transcriptional regulator [Lachnospiraceae bacterium]
MENGFTDNLLGKETLDMEEELTKKMELGKFLQDHQESFVDYEMADLLGKMIDEKKISKAELARRAQMSDIYLFQILGGRRSPSRDRLLCICIGMECTLPETRDLLKKGRFADLYARDRRDAIVMFALDKGWSLRECNEALYEAGEKTLV